MTRLQKCLEDNSILSGSSHIFSSALAVLYVRCIKYIVYVTFTASYPLPVVVPEPISPSQLPSESAPACSHLVPVPLVWESFDFVVLFSHID